MTIKRRSAVSEISWILCITAIWLVVFYSSTIQHKILEIPNGMLLLGSAVVIFYILSNSDELLDLKSVFTPESIVMLAYMAYMLPMGFLFSPDLEQHTSQWIRSMEFMIIMIIISSVVLKSGTESFHIMLLVNAFILAVVFLKDPVYYAGGRYSISLNMNPNGLGMQFTSGIWAVLYQQQKRNIPLIIPGAVISLFGYCIMLTGSRKALIAAGIVIMTWLLLCYFPKLKERDFLNALLSLLFLILIIVILGVLFSRVYTDSTIAGRMSGLQREVTEGKRSNMYREGWELFKLNPLFGIGFQGFAYYYKGYSHATLVEIPVSSGAVGTIIYFTAFIISIIKCLYLYSFTAKNDDMLSERGNISMLLALWAALLFYCICIIHHYQLESFILLGIILGQTNYLESKIKVLENNEAVKNKWKYIKQ